MLGTILILALTVTLFSSIFFFVNTFPKPATQPASQFTGVLNYTSIGSKSYVSFVTVTHIGGPSLFNFNTQIYVVSQAHPGNTTTVYSLSSGGLGAGPQASWGTGQVWSLNLAGPHLVTPDNITVTIVSAGTVVYRQILPGTNPTIPPIFDQEGTNPGTPTVNSPFSVFVQISDPFLRTTSTQVYLNITTPGLTCSGLNANGTHQMTYNATTGLWSDGGCTTATSGTYYVSVWAKDTNPIQVLQNSIIFPISVATSGGGGGGGSSLVVVSILTNTSVPVVNQPLSVVVQVTNSGAAPGTATVNFGPSAGGTYSPTTTSGTVGAGATVGFQTTFTPTVSGPVVLSSSAAIPGIGSGSATLALTVFPKILLVSENVPALTAPSKSNESALLASELAAAGFPFTTVFVPCATVTSYPVGVVSQFTPTAVVIVDFGSNSSNSASCKGPDYNVTNSVAAQITSAFNNGTSFWVVGNRAFLSQASGCESGTYRNYLAIFGIRNSNSNCYVTSNAITLATGAPVTYAPSVTMLSAGITNPLSLNGNVTAVTTYANYKTFQTTGGGVSFMTDAGGHNLGTFNDGASPKGAAVATGADPAQFGDGAPPGFPVGPSWGAAGALVAYNVVNFLTDLATNSAPTRAGADFGIAGAFLPTAPSHTSPNSILVNLRANDASNGILTVMLLVNGVPAIYQGNFVQATAVESSNGGNSWVTLTWQPASAGAYVLSFVLSTQPVDGYLQNNQYNYYITNGAIVF